MITIQQFFEAIQYRITEGADYCWVCYGPNAFSIDSWDGDQQGKASSVVFSTKTQEVFEATAANYADPCTIWRWVNPKYLEALKKEHEERGHTFGEAWDDISFIEIEDPTEFLDIVRKNHT